MSFYKSIGSPFAELKIKDFEPNNCEKSFIVVPNKRCKLNKDYNIN